MCVKVYQLSRYVSRFPLNLTVEMHSNQKEKDAKRILLNSYPNFSLQQMQQTKKDYRYKYKCRKRPPVIRK